MKNKATLKEKKIEGLPSFFKDNPWLEILKERS
jgi:hypothetical protein